MRINMLDLLLRRFRLRHWIFLMLLFCYIGISLCVFFKWIAPTLDGRSDQHIAADSTTYLYFASSLREGSKDPAVIAGLLPFPNTLWCPVLLAWILKSTFAMVVANYAMFFLAIALLKKAFSFSAWGFMALLILNATTDISLLSVNKEIVDLLTISIFLFAWVKRYKGVVLVALLLALFNRFEVCIVLLLYMFFEGKLNPLRRRRGITLAILVILLSVMLPLLASGSLNSRFEEAKEGHVIAWLDFLEIHYLYVAAVIPKIAENLFAELINFPKAGAYLAFSDIANTYIVFFNNLATAVVLCILVKKGTFNLKFDLVYFACIGWIIMAIALVVQPRYFYFAYVLLCLQASQTVGQDRRGSNSQPARNRAGEDYARSDKEAAFG